MHGVITEFGSRRLKRGPSFKSWLKTLMSPVVKPTAMWSCVPSGGKHMLEMKVPAHTRYQITASMFIRIC